MNSREGRNPQFPRTREFFVPLPQHLKKYSVIPAKAGIHNSRARGNSTTHTPRKNTRHSREGGNPQFPSTRPQERKNTPSFPRRRESIIPADAGIHRPIPQRPKKYSVIPAKAGIHNSRARGNSSTHTPTPEKILRHEGGNRNARGNSSTHTPTPEKILRHSREGGNPTCTRESDPFPEKILRHSREGGNP